VRGVASALRFVPLALVGAFTLVVVGEKLARRAPAGAGATTTSAASDAVAPRTIAGPGAVDAGAPAPVTMTHGGPTRAHRSAAQGPHAAKRVWRAELDGPIQGQVVTSPDEQTLYAATLGGKLVALDRRGSRRFTVDLGERAYGAPCVASDGTIYAGSDAKRFFGVRPDGAIAFRLEVDGEADTACVVAGGLVLFAAGSTVYAVRPGGDVAWRFRAKGKVFTAPAVAVDGLVVFGAQDDRAYGVREGKLIFATDLGADVDGAPVVLDDGTFAFGTDTGEVVFVDASGAVRSRVKLGGYVRGTLALGHDGAVLAGVYGPTPKMVRVVPSGLVAAFAVQGTGSVDFGVHGGALEDRDGTVFFGAQDDRVYAVDRDGVRFTYDAGGDVDAPLTLLSDGTLVVASDAGHVDYLAP
jgi:outer membrane protein assembly factor BamB